MDSRSFTGLSEDNQLINPYFTQLYMETKVHKACINTMGFDEPTKMYSSKSQFPPPNDTSEVEEIPLYTEDGEMFKCGIIEPDPEACLQPRSEPRTESEIYNEVIEWLELEHDEYLEGFNREKLLSYCVAIENE